MRLEKGYRILLIIVFGLITLLVFYSMYKMINLDRSVNQVKEKINYVNDKEKQLDYNQLISDYKKKYNNEDIVGILEIVNEEKKIPIVQTSDNDFYLNHDLDKKSSDKGSIFLDYRVDINSSKKLLVYGHSSENIYTDFNFLQEFYDKEYYDTHKYLEITTNTIKKKYEIFSVYTEIEDFSYMQTDFNNDLDYLNHINELKNNSIYDTNVKLSEKDEILIIQTCSMNSDYSKYKDKYLLIISRRV